ncbi:MAG TPA: helix-turn-helix transcriptional regulator [Chloroflexota bacterium]|nr:helix-turn-helix transcriptional regulator [Chloroflexota bacterium]
MNKQARAARAAEQAQALDAALDREIERAVGPLRVTAAEIDSLAIDTGAAANSALPPRRAAALVRSLRRALGTAESAQPAPAAVVPFGELLRRNRERARLDVGDVARRLHVHRDYLAGIETGARSPLALGPDGAKRLVTLLGIPPGAATAALELAMRVAVAPTATFTARMKRGVPRETRKRLLEQALPTTPEQSHLTEWREMIDAVGELELRTEPSPPSA